IGAWRDMDDTVQAKYVPRGLVYNLAAGVKTFVWLLTSGTDANEDDDFGLIHGMKFLPQDFTPRPVWATYSNTLALFSDTKSDPSIGVTVRAPSPLPHLMAYGFRSRTGKAIVAYWLGVRSLPGKEPKSQPVMMVLKNSGFRHPVLADVTTCEIRPLECKTGR